MAKRYYPAWVHKNRESSYGISFPDVPGCISAGDTLEACLANGEAALNFHLEGLAEDGQAWPEPSALESAIAAADPEDADDLVTVQLVPAVLPSKAIRLTITMDEELVKRIDTVAGHYGRSGWIAEASREKLAASRFSSDKRPAVRKAR